MHKTCPVCGAPGEDLVFTFECSNPECQNFVARSPRPAPREPEDEDSEPDPFGPEWMARAD